MVTGTSFDNLEPNAVTFLRLISETIPSTFLWFQVVKIPVSNMPEKINQAKSKHK